MRHKTYVLAKEILERKDVLFGLNDNVAKPHSMKEKEDAWESVRIEMIEQGFANFERKSWRDVRNHDWQYLRRSAVAKYEHNQKNSNEPVQYNEVDKLVFEIMGNEDPSLHFDSLCNFSMDSHNTMMNDFHEQQATGNVDVTPVPTLQLHRTLSRDQDKDINLNSPTSIVSPSSMETKSFLLGSSQQKGHNEHTSTNGLSSADIHNGFLSNLLTSSKLINQTFHRGEDRNEANSQTSKPEGVKNSYQIQCRKRQHSQSPMSEKFMDNDLSEAKLKLILLQVKKEEIMVEQEKQRLVQEELKVRQERAKAEILELQLRAEKTRMQLKNNSVWQ